MPKMEFSISNKKGLLERSYIFFYDANDDSQAIYRYDRSIQDVNNEDYIQVSNIDEKDRQEMFERTNDEGKEILRKLFDKY